eukprot:22884_1
MAGANLGIMNSSREYAATAHGVKTKQQKISEYRKMRKSVEVYFIDHFNDPRNSDISLGIWQISFGQFVFKFTEPIAGMPDTIIFNGLLPAVGLTLTNINHWKDKASAGKPTATDTEHHHEHTTHDTKQKSEETETRKEESDEEVRRRRLPLDDDSHKASEPDGESSSHYTQVITPNGADGGNLEFWVVHNDPDDSVGFAVSASTDKDKLFSNNWVDFSSHCTKKGSATAKEEHGDCSALNSDIDEHIVAHLSEHKYCKKIVLCKNGAYKFEFKQGFASTVKHLTVNAAKLTDKCVGNDCQFQRLVHVTVQYDEPEPSRCPRPSIALTFKCAKHWNWTPPEDIFPDFEFKTSMFYGKQLGMEYRVIPPEIMSTSQAAEGQEETINDPYVCKDKKGHGKYRPRFQVRGKDGKIKTCCIVDEPQLGTGPSIPYYWPDQRQMMGGEAGGEAGDEAVDKDENPRTRNRIPESAVVGKTPPELPSKAIRDRVVGFRKDKGMSEEDANRKIVTKEEYEEIVKNEEAVKNPADPDEHKISSNMNVLSITHSVCVIGVTLLFIGISSCFLFSTTFA